MSTGILIAKNCEPTSNYQAACSLKKPICGVKMIDALWKERGVHVNERVNSDRNDFPIKLFTGCIITFSDF
jgi:hypothetical protein